MARSVPARAEVPTDYTWDAASIFPTEAAWEAALTGMSESLPDLDRFRGHVGDSSQTLLGFLRAVDHVVEVVEKVYVYAQMLYDVDTADQAAKGRQDRAITLGSRVAAAVSYGEPEILTIGRDTLARWVEQDPQLSVYGHYFDSLFHRQEHVRSAEVEEVLGLVGDPFATASATHSVLSDTDLTFEPAHTASGDRIEIAQGNIDALISDADRQLRRTAWENYADSYLALKNTAANCLAAGAKQHVLYARVRRYASPLEAALAPNHIPVEVFHSLIETCRRKISTWHRYWAIKRRALQYQTFHVYDIKAPLLDRPLEIPYERSVEMVIEGMRALGPEYVEPMRRGLTQERWVDVYPNLHKASGAYSTGSYGTFPFILMNYNDDMEGMSTLAHELGHSMHSYFSWGTQPRVYADYSMFVAEVASNFNQALVRAHLLQTNTDPEFQIALIEEAMSNFHRYFFIMPTLARFELELHERAWRGDAFSADDMIDLMTDLFREGYGEEVEIDHDRIGITWAQFPTHLYANFYVYQYATGISAAQSLAEGVLTEKPGAVERYLAFLKAGDSLYPLDALRLAGVDMTSPEPVEQAFASMARMVDRLAQLLEQRGVEGEAART